MKKISLLLVSAGSLVGKNLIEVISRSRASFYLAGTNSLDNFDSLHQLDEFYLCPPSDTIAFQVGLEELILKINPDIVIPCRDEEAVVLARIAESNPDLATRISLVDAGLATQFLDKYQSYLLCQKMNLPFAHTILLKGELSGQLTFPMIAKPRQGFASRGVKLITSMGQLEGLRPKVKDYILQEYLSQDESILSQALDFEKEGFPLHFSFEEEKYSIQLSLCSTLVSSDYFLGRHVMKNGLSYEVDRFRDAELENLARESLERFHGVGVRGPLNIQLQKSKSGDFKIFEFNCRFTGATSARYFLGYNELDLLVLDKLGWSPFEEKMAGFSKARKVVQTIGVE